MPWVIGGAALGGALLSSSAAGKAADKQQQTTNAAVEANQKQYDTSRADLAPYREAGSAALSRLRNLLGISSPVMSAGDWAVKAGYTAPVGRDWSPDEIKYLTDKGGYGDYLSQHGADTSPSAPSDGGSLLSKFSTADLAADPVYGSGLQFGLDEGTKAIERRAAAGGGYDSGATLKALTRFGNDYGSTKAGESYSRFTNDQDRTFGKLSGIAGMGSGATTVGVGAGTGAASNLAGLYTGQGNANAASTIAQGNALSGGTNSIGNYYMQQNLLSQLQGGGARSLAPKPELTGSGDLGTVA